MAENRPSLHGARNIRALQRAVGSLLNLQGAQDVGQALGPNGEVWAEVITTEMGRSAQVTLIDPARYGLPDYSTIEVINVQNASPDFIATPKSSHKDTTMTPTKVANRGQQLRIAGAIATIVSAGAKK